MTDQPSTPPMGERRRRREAERRRAQESGEGLTPPLTRRERRALEEALASGALELTPDGQYAPTGELPVTTTGQHALSGMETAASAESADTEQSRADRAAPAEEAPEAGAKPAAPEPKPAEPEARPASPEPPERQSWRDTALEVEALHPPPTMAPTPDGVASGAPAASAGSAGTGEQDAAPGQVSRRSLRQRQAEPSPSQPERPSERTATGRRPVIRPPASALGTRSVDGATGELTAIQRAIRDINAAPDEPVTDSVLQPVDTDAPASETSPAETSPAENSSPAEVSSPEAADRPEEASAAAIEVSPMVASPAAPQPAGAGTTEASPAAQSPTADSPAEEDVDDSFDMSPRWPSVAAVAEQSAEPAEQSPPDSAQDGPAADAGRSARSAGSPVPADEPGHEPALADAHELDDTDEDDERHTPRLLQVLYWVVLVLAGVVLGLLVWRMATGDLFGDGDALAATSRMVLRQ